MKKLNPTLRYIASTSHLPNKDFVKAYDCRFFFVLAGTGELLTNEKRFTLTKNILAYYPAGVPYFLSSDPENPLSFVTVNFDFTRTFPEHKGTLRPVKLCDYQSELERPTQTELEDDAFRSAFICENAYSLRNDLITLCSLFGKKEKYTDELCSALLKYVILKIAAQRSGREKSNPIVNKTVVFIENNYQSKLTNNEIAARLGYHPYYLSSLLKAHKGKTMHEYLLQTRLDAAADLLLHTDSPISEVATKCGFQNAEHFCVKFKKLYNASPTVWRKRNSIV